MGVSIDIFTPIFLVYSELQIDSKTRNPHNFTKHIIFDLYKNHSIYSTDSKHTDLCKFLRLDLQYIDKEINNFFSSWKANPLKFSGDLMKIQELLSSIHPLVKEQTHDYLQARIIKETNNYIKESNNPAYYLKNGDRRSLNNNGDAIFFSLYQPFCKIFHPNSETINSITFYTNLDQYQPLNNLDVSSLHKFQNLLNRNFHNLYYHMSKFNTNTTGTDAGDANTHNIFKHVLLDFLSDTIKRQEGTKLLNPYSIINDEKISAALNITTKTLLEGSVLKAYTNIKEFTSLEQFLAIETTSLLTEELSHIKICQQCKKIFIATHGNNKFCPYNLSGDSCSSLHQKEENKKRKYEGGKAFELFEQAKGRLRQSKHRIEEPNEYINNKFSAMQDDLCNIYQNFLTECERNEISPKDVDEKTLSALKDKFDSIRAKTGIY